MPKDIPPTPEVKTPAPTQRQGKSAKTRWQERLLPIMGGLLIGLAIFFFAASFIQMTYLHTSILNYPKLSVDSGAAKEVVASGQTFDERLQARRLELLANMEAYVVGRRYHQASVALMASLWVRYLGFVTGMILALVGASFVLGRLSEPASSISGKTSLLDFSVRSTSPGIILVVLGVILMFATITDKDEFQVKDAPVYLMSGAGLSDLSLPEPVILPTLSIPDKYLTPETIPTPGGP